MASVSSELPVLDDERTLEVANVVWCTGSDIDLAWIDIPLALTDGYPDQHRGVVAGHPGLYLVGLPFLRSLSSALLGGVGRDAAHIADHIDGRARVPAGAPMLWAKMAG